MFHKQEFVLEVIKCIVYVCMYVGQLVELCREHPDNEHWWEVQNEDGEIGFVPSSYVIVREEVRASLKPHNLHFDCLILN